MAIFLWVVGLLVGAFLLDRLLLWAEARGWVNYRRKGLSRGGATYHALELQSMFNPSTREVMEVQYGEEEQEDESGAPPAGGPDRGAAIQVLKEPSECSEAELGEFERLVRSGFGGSDRGLPARIRSAARLAFHFDPEHRAIAVAGLKRPTAEYIAAVFARAERHLASTDRILELGWVFVAPEHRGAGIGRALCAELLGLEERARIFATTRPDNLPMITILESLGFEQTGIPFSRRDHELLLYIRSGRWWPTV